MVVCDVRSDPSRSDSVRKDMDLGTKHLGWERQDTEDN